MNYDEAPCEVTKHLRDNYFLRVEGGQATAPNRSSGQQAVLWVPHRARLVLGCDVGSDARDAVLNCVRGRLEGFTRPCNSGK